MIALPTRPKRERKVPAKLKLEQDLLRPLRAGADRAKRSAAADRREAERLQRAENTLAERAPREKVLQCEDGTSATVRCGPGLSLKLRAEQMEPLKGVVDHELLKVRNKKRAPRPPLSGARTRRDTNAGLVVMDGPAAGAGRQSNVYHGRHGDGLTLTVDVELKSEVGRGVKGSNRETRNPTLRAFVMGFSFKGSPSTRGAGIHTGKGLSGGKRGRAGRGRARQGHRRRRAARRPPLLVVRRRRRKKLEGRRRPPVSAARASASSRALDGKSSRRASARRPSCARAASAAPWRSRCASTGTRSRARGG